MNFQSGYVTKLKILRTHQFYFICRQQVLLRCPDGFEYIFNMYVIYIL